MLPLSAYEDLSAFKLYACDCGLLRRLAKLPSDVVLSPTANYTEFKGAMAENAILQSLMPILNRDMPFYWSSDSRAEIEFVIQWHEEIIPIEVKAENCISGRSLSVYNERYKPKHRVRFSFQNLLCNCGLLSCPSPLADWLPKLLLMAWDLVRKDFFVRGGIEAGCKNGACPFSHAWLMCMTHCHLLVMPVSCHQKNLCHHQREKTVPRQIGTSFVVYARYRKKIKT